MSRTRILLADENSAILGLESEMLRDDSDIVGEMLAWRDSDQIS